MNKSPLPRPLLFWMSALLALNVIPSLFTRPVWVGATALFFVCCRMLVDLDRLRILPRWFLTFVQCAFVAVIYLEYQTFLGEDASGALLILLAGLKLFEMRSLRDVRFLIVVCYFLLMDILINSQTIMISAFALCDFILIQYSLYLAQSRTPPSRESIKNQIGLFLKGLPIAVLLFVAFPRCSTGFGHNGNALQEIGFENRLSPGTVSRLISSDQLAFRVSAPGGTTHVQDFYWRGSVLTHSQGLSWDRPAIARSNGAFDGNIPSTARVYEIILEPRFGTRLFSLKGTQGIQVDSRFWRHHLSRDEEDIFSLQLPASKALIYRLIVDDSEPSLRAYSKRDLQLPGKPSSDVRRLIRPWRDLKDAEKARRILRYYKTQKFTYSLAPRPSNNVDEFLFQTKQGFCEHYAAVTADLLRWMGVPADVVIGFQGGLPSLLDNHLSIRDYDAHAWVEYYDRQARQWTRLDPTIVVAPDRLAMGSASYFDGRVGARFQLGWFSYVLIHYTRVLRAMDEAEASWQMFLLKFDIESQRNILNRWGLRTAFAWLWLLAGSIALVLAAVGFSAWWESRFQRRSLLRQKTYRQVLKFFESKGVKKPLFMGPLDFSRICIQEFPACHRPIEGLFDLIIELRYGVTGEKSPGREALRKEVEEKLKEVKRSVAAHGGTPSQSPGPPLNTTHD